MKKLLSLVALVGTVAALAGCRSSCEPNPCAPCVAEPVYQSPCCPAPSGRVGQGSAPAMAPAAAPAAPAAEAACGAGGKACGK